jgi:hypothetical protein
MVSVPYVVAGGTQEAAWANGVDVSRKPTIASKDTAVAIPALITGFFLSSLFKMWGFLFLVISIIFIIT